MEKNAIKFSNLKWYIQFVLFFVITFLVSFIVLYTMTKNTLWQVLVYSTLCGLFFGFTSAVTMWLGKQGSDFYDTADEIEKMIRSNVDKEEVVTAIFKLRSKSFHRNTSDRLTELAKMSEIKYNITLLKS